MRGWATRIISAVVLNALFAAGPAATMGTAAARNITRPDPGVPLAPAPLPAPGPARDGAEIARLLMGVSRSSFGATAGGGAGGEGARVRLVKKVAFEGELWEPEGVVRLAGAPRAASSGGDGGEDGDDGDGERFWVSAGEYTVPTERYPGGRWVDGTDRSAGAGFAHFVVFDGTGRRLADWVVSREGDLEYHNGGLDYDGRHIWATLSQYRPNTTGTVVRIDPEGLEMEEVFRVKDHQGGIVHDVETGTLVTLNWGGRKGRRWDLRRRGDGATSGEGQARLGGGRGDAFDAPDAEVVNPSHWVDYQDCKSLGHYGGRPVMLCSGIATLGPGVEVGGLAIVDAESLVPIWEVPFMERADVGGAGGDAGKGVLLTKNPMDVALVDGKVRLYFLPEEGRSTLYVYEVSEQ
ncbi:hypothetical protein EsH8_VIII_001007 [Colletotrichum jinshuiense]